MISEESITYDCPKCLTHYVVWDASTMPPITPERYNDLSEIVRKQVDDKGYCRKCYREDGIATTLEMDGILKQEDILDRFYVMKPCMSCAKYSKQDIRNEFDTPCPYCEGKDFSIQSSQWASLRTYNPSKKKLTKAQLKAVGG